MLPGRVTERGKQIGLYERADCACLAEASSIGRSLRASAPYSESIGYVAFALRWRHTCLVSLKVSDDNFVHTVCSFIRALCTLQLALARRHPSMCVVARNRHPHGLSVA